MSTVMCCDSFLSSNCTLREKELSFAISLPAFLIEETVHVSVTYVTIIWFFFSMRLLKEATFVGLVTCGVIYFQIKICIRCKRKSRPLSVHIVVTFVCCVVTHLYILFCLLILFYTLLCFLALCVSIHTDAILKLIPLVKLDLCVYLTSPPPKAS